MVHDTATHRVLKFALAEREEGGMAAVLANPFVVSCYYCETTMWSFSDNALVELDEHERITCRSRDCTGSREGELVIQSN